MFHVFSYNEMIDHHNNMDYKVDVVDIVEEYDRFVRWLKYLNNNFHLMTMITVYQVQLNNMNSFEYY